MLLLEVDGVRKSFNDHLLFTIDHLQMFSGQRVGLIGANGSGKTTLLQIIQGKQEPDHGDVRLFGSLAAVQQFGVEPQPAPNENGLAQRWRVPQRLLRSGGEDTRAQLATVSAANAHLLLLDEPTSHLDLDGRNQLADDLADHPGAVLIVSHDRSFLDKLCTHIWDLSNQTITVHVGNYSAFAETKRIQEAAQQSAYVDFMSEKRRLERAIQDRSSQAQGMRSTPKRMGNSEARLHKRAVGVKRAKVDRSAKTMETRLEKLGTVDKPFEENPIHFDLYPNRPRGGSWALRAENVIGQVAQYTVFDNLNLQLPRGGKLAVIGPNGSGKTTFLRSLERRDQEGLRLPPESRIGYFRQDLDNLDANHKLLHAVSEYTVYSETFVRTILARLGFRRDQLGDRIQVMSGGERVKAILAQLIVSQNDLLIMDEPTNYLDMQSMTGLTNVLRAYPGTVIIASHDQTFLEGFADHILDFSQRPPRFFMGTWQEYHRPVLSTDAADELVLRTKEAQLAAALENATDSLVRKQLSDEWKDVNAQLRLILQNRKTP